MHAVTFPSPLTTPMTMLLLRLVAVALIAPPALPRTKPIVNYGFLTADTGSKTPLVRGFHGRQAETLQWSPTSPTLMMDPHTQIAASHGQKGIMAICCKDMKRGDPICGDLMTTTDSEIMVHGDHSIPSSSPSSHTIGCL